MLQHRQKESTYEAIPVYSDLIRVLCFVYGGAAKLEINHHTFTIANAGCKGRTESESQSQSGYVVWTERGSG